jgi:hypothetical protein
MTVANAVKRITSLHHFQRTAIMKQRHAVHFPVIIICLALFFAATAKPMVKLGEISTHWDLNKMSEVTIHKGYCYVTHADSGLQIIDIHAPEAPVKVGRYQPDHQSQYRECLFIGSTCVVASGDFYLTFFSDVLASDGEVVEYMPTGGRSSGDYLAYSAPLLVVGSKNDGNIDIVDCSDLAAPVLKAVLKADNTLNDIDVDGNYCYAAHEDTGISIIDLSDPEQPVVVGTYNEFDESSFEEAVGVSVQGNRLYVAVSRVGVRVLDITDKSAPVLLGEYSQDLVESPIDVRANDETAYAICSNVAITGIDFGDVTAPVKIDNYNTLLTEIGSNIYAGDIENDTAAILLSNNELHIVNLKAGAEIRHGQTVRYRQVRPELSIKAGVCEYRVPSATNGSGKATLLVHDLHGRLLQKVPCRATDENGMLFIWDMHTSVTARTMPVVLSVAGDGARLFSSTGFIVQ